MSQSLLSVNNLTVAYPGHGKTAPVMAVDGVGFFLNRNEVLGLVGESGCGKTTLCRAIMRLVPFSGGPVLLEGRDLGRLSGHELRAIRPRMQMVFQDPYASLDPRMSVYDILSEPLRFLRKIKRGQCPAEVARLMEQVGLSPDSMYKYPHEFSGGQRQRVAIARALAPRPRLIIADEPVSALDVSIQAQILNLLIDLRKTMDLAMLFISHDLSVVRHISDRIAVMYGGKIVETGQCRAIFDAPQHSYTRTLLAAVPAAKPGGMEG